MKWVTADIQYVTCILIYVNALATIKRELMNYSWSDWYSNIYTGYINFYIEKDN